MSFERIAYLTCLIFLSPASSALAQDMPVPAPDENAAIPEDHLPPLGAGPSQQLTGALGSYSMMRDSSGTSWQPESSPMDAIHGLYGDWSTMLHGYVFGVYDHQGGKRGGTEAFSESMLMGMAQRQIGMDTLTLRAMFSLDPLMGKSGYPLLLQTGETANGKTPLIDRQHPHDFLMELAGVYSVPVGVNASAFLYAGYPGEPALGPPTFMHRFSGMDNPEAPLGHHWLDSTHVTFGVVTAGFVYREWKFEGSLFNGREPDQNRWGWDRIRLNSESVRLTYNPAENWSFQASYGVLSSPEQLEPGTDQRRVTVSGIYNRKFEDGNWQTTLAWGQNDFAPGPILNAVLLESAISWRQHTVFARAEDDEKNELFTPPSPLTGRTFSVASFSAGYVYDVPVAEHLSLGLGGMGSFYDLPRGLDHAFGVNPMSYVLFTRLKLK